MNQARSNISRIHLVERLFCAQLRATGWKWMEGDIDVPEFTERASFHEVLLQGCLATALRDLDPTFPATAIADAESEQVLQAQNSSHSLSSPFWHDLVETGAA